MKNWFADHYDKILLLSAFSFLMLQIFVTGGIGFQSDEKTFKYSQFRIINVSDEIFIEPLKNTNILPGSSLYYRHLEQSDWSELVVKSVSLIKRQSIVLYTIDNKKVEGTLVGDFTLKENWRNSVESISIRQQRDTIFVPFKKVTQISSRQRIKIPDNLKDYDWSNHELSFFQRLNLSSASTDQLPSKPKWIGSNLESNSTKYDLFTPPIIYLDDGKLTTRLPEKEKPQELQEAFGLKLISANKSPYFLKLSSWVGDAPYFEDKNAPLSENSTKFTRNRLEVGKFYKRDYNRKPGQPSLIECNESDPDCLIQIEHFVVQQHKNAKTGGLRLVGRSLIRDYDFGGEPFEINSIMAEVFAGDYTFAFEFNLPDQETKNINLSSKDEGKIFSFAGRTYEVTEIDLKSNYLTIVKKDPRVLEDIEKKFKFTGR